jgi:hypothetical protein
MTCKYFQSLPDVAGISDFIERSTTFKKESIKIHNEGIEHK